MSQMQLYINVRVHKCQRNWNNFMTVCMFVWLCGIWYTPGRLFPSGSNGGVSCAASFCHLVMPVSVSALGSDLIVKINALNDKTVFLFNFFRE